MFCARVRSGPAGMAGLPSGPIGKLLLSGLKIALAGSVESRPKVMVGTTPPLKALLQKLIWLKLAPKLRLCEPRAQLTVSLNCLTGALRRLGARFTVGLARPARPKHVVAEPTLLPIAKPF